MITSIVMMTMALVMTIQGHDDDDDFLREQKMVAPTYQELAADQVIAFSSCKDVLTILLLVSAVIMLKDTFIVIVTSLSLGKVGINSGCKKAVEVKTAISVAKLVTRWST